MKRILTGVVGAFATLLVASLAQAADIRVETPETATSPAVVTVAGRFKEPDYRRFIDITAGIKRATVFFHSEGGWSPAAVMMAETIQSRGYNTAVANHQICYSACALAWLGGKKRFLGIPAELGFHRPYNYWNQGITKAQAEMFAAYLQRYRISESVVAKLLTPGRPNPQTIMVFVRNDIDANSLGIEPTRTQIPKYVPP
jgi:hypothetical protein